MYPFAKLAIDDLNKYAHPHFTIGELESTIQNVVNNACAAQAHYPTRDPVVQDTKAAASNKELMQ